jgi:hypothetical protein
MIKLKQLLIEAEWDNIASRVWDYIISNEVHITKESLQEISDEVAKRAKIQKRGLYDAVLRIAEEKNWFTQFILNKVFK